MTQRVTKRSAKTPPSLKGDPGRETLHRLTTPTKFCRAMGTKASGLAIIKTAANQVDFGGIGGYR
jgi:hypothetical protein